MGSTNSNEKLQSVRDDFEKMKRLTLRDLQGEIGRITDPKDLKKYDKKIARVSWAFDDLLDGLIEAAQIINKYPEQKPE